MRPTRRRPERGPFALLALTLSAFLTSLGLAGVSKVKVELPVPARINTRAVKKVLVARFLAPEHPTVDALRRFVRRSDG